MKERDSIELNCLCYHDDELFKDGWLAEAHLNNAKRELLISES
jgi:hypothetical protein